MTQNEPVQIVSNSERETVAFAAEIAGKMGPGVLLCLSGDLGTGKTVFARALIRALAGDEDLTVPSPTFGLLQIYETPRGTVRHFDLYRIETPEDIYELGWDEGLLDSITLLEWPGRLEGFLPDTRIEIRIDNDPDDPDRRVITMQEKTG